MKPALIQFPTFAEENGTLAVFETGKAVPFIVRRVFTVSASLGDIRGQHAHKKCAQLLVCVAGRVRVSCTDGEHTSDFVLDSMGVGLLVPPGIWAEQQYDSGEAVLMVLCDHQYDPDDYIRDYAEFIGFKQTMKNSSQGAS